jgi:hypothetical protein
MAFRRYCKQRTRPQKRLERYSRNTFRRAEVITADFAVCAREIR